MASFKLKLVTFFLLLALLPVAAAFWGFSAVERRSETRRVDARIQAGLRAVLVGYADGLDSAGRTAAELASNPSFQRALIDRDANYLHTLLEDSPEIRVEAPGGFRIGLRRPLAAEAEVAVAGAQAAVGRVIVSVPLNLAGLRELKRRSGLAPEDELVVVRDGRVAAGADVGAALATPSDRTRTIEVAGTRYRVLAARPLPTPAGARLVVISPQHEIDAATMRSQRSLLVRLLAALGFIALLAYILSRGIVRTLGELVRAAHAIAQGRLEERVPVRGRDEFAELGLAFNDMAEQLQARAAELEDERRRLREATQRMGETLAATHDPDQLLNVIVEAAVETTGAAGATLVPPDGEPIRFGSPGVDGDHIELPLTAGASTFGTLILQGPAFDEETRETAVALAGQAVVALENARLHRIVERQALVDGLTGLDNRRHVEDELHAEIARAERFDGPIALVLADLDNFKSLNDRYGHPFGDAVLREFAQTVRECVREVDHAGRWGGEEFAIVLPGADLEGGAHLAERVREALEARVVLSPEGQRVPITASFGVASYPEAADQDAIVAAADEALYRAKRGGKNRVATAADTVSSR